MIDPPREEAIKAVRACQAAGIRVKMITGDHAVTAAAIAGQIGLDDALAAGEIPKVLSGRELEAMSDAELIRSASGTAVFARVTPEQKLRLVEALQAHGEVAAMTGDGVNDAPALRRADIGIAMGITGTEVSKEAADMVLTDDNFATIEAAVEEGRGVFDNLDQISHLDPADQCRSGTGDHRCRGDISALACAACAGAVDQYDHRRAARPGAGFRAS